MPYFCVANGDLLEDFCWLDRDRPDLCWVDNQPGKKEDCEYWEEHNHPLDSDGQKLPQVS